MLTRAYDHIYDPHYITSHANDHHRQTSKAMFQASRIDRVPDDKSKCGFLGYVGDCSRWLSLFAELAVQDTERTKGLC